MMTEEFKEAVDNSNEFGALLTDLSKACDCIDYSLLLATLCRYGVSHASIKLIFSYFESQIQRNKIRNCFSKSSKIDYGVPQGSILCPLFFNINLISMERF